MNKFKAMINITKQFKQRKLIASSIFLGVSLSAFYYTKNQKTTLLCDSSQDKESLNQLEDKINRDRELNNQLKNNFNDEDNNTFKPDLEDFPTEMMDDENAAAIQNILENPDADPETYNEIMKQYKQMNVQPPQFKVVNNMFKCHDDNDEHWNGLKLGVEYSPIQTFKFETESLFDPKQGRVTKHNFFSMNPSRTNPHKSVVVVGRYNPTCFNSAQCHFTLSENEKLSLVANFKENDPSQFMYEVEYNKILERMNISAKYGNNGSGLSCTVNAWKNIHLGLEGMLNPKSGEVMWSYAASIKPHKKVGIAATYMSYMPMYTLDIFFKVSIII